MGVEGLQTGRAVVIAHVAAGVHRCAIERACAALPADFPAAIRDSITAGALSHRVLIKATASK
jgi:hypothetical protein